MSIEFTGHSDVRISKKLREARFSQNHHFAIVPTTTKYNKYNWRLHRSSIRPDDIEFKNKGQILEDSGMNDENLVTDFYEKLEKLLKDVRAKAVDGECDSWLVEHAEGADGLTIGPPRPENEKPVRGLSGELLERVKGASP